MRAAGHKHDRAPGYLGLYGGNKEIWLPYVCFAQIAAIAQPLGGGTKSARVDSSPWQGFLSSSATLVGAAVCRKGATADRDIAVATRFIRSHKSQERDADPAMRQEGRMRSCIPP